MAESSGGRYVGIGKTGWSMIRSFGIGSALDSLRRPHFLRRTGFHFAGKCSSEIPEGERSCSNALNAGLLVGATVRRLQCPVQAIDQAVIAVRLAQEANRPGFQGPPAQTFLGKRRDEDNGKVMTLRDQSVLQFDSAQSRHMQIGNQA